MRACDVPRPWGNGYALSLYDQVRRDIRDFRREIDWHRQEVAAHSRGLMSARSMLIQAEHTLAWMKTHQSEEIAELEAARAKVQALLKRGSGGK